MFRRCRSVLWQLIFLNTISAGILEAGVTPQFQQIQGPSIGLFNGDWVSTGVAVAPNPAGLNTYYSYFIEVPQGTPALVVDIFDADIRENFPNADAFDTAQGSPNTNTGYFLFTPTGAVFGGSFFLLGPAAGANFGCGFCDNAWVTFWNIPNPAPGHWELRINQSLALQNFAGTPAPYNNINALLVQAYDGNFTSGGQELNLYARSYGALGNTTGATGVVNYDLFPYVTSGCEVDSNDFDCDNVGLLSITSRSGAAAWAPLVSGATNWANNTLGGFTTDQAAVEYGVWSVDYGVGAISGTFPVNWVTYYFGAWNAANPSGVPPGPPTGQPEANSLRTYFATDAVFDPMSVIVPPPKAYVEQLLTHRSGPNPAQIGQQSIFTVTVRVVNPTSRPITFGSVAADVVTARVPGGDAVYGGAALVSQGTVTSQPTLGAAGNVVWNPGVVAAGATAGLAYDVRVTPTGGRVPVTGGPPTNAGTGTTARFVDGTCVNGAGTVVCANANQRAGATTTFGELCELAVTPMTLTHAPIAAFSAVAEGRGAVVTWETASEAGTLGFHLWRNGERLNEDLLLGLLSAPQGGSYRYRDAAIGAGETATYWLEEVELRGPGRRHGPFTVTVEAAKSSEASPLSGEYDRRPKEPAPLAEVLPRPAATVRGLGGEEAPSLEIGVRTSGIYRLAATDLAAAFGVPLAKVERWLRLGKLSLRLGDVEVAWRASGKSAAGEPAGLEFYGQAAPSLYSLDTVYRLTPKVPGLLMEEAAAAPAPLATGEESFQATADFEEDAIPLIALGLDPASDYWFWRLLRAAEPGQDRQVFDVAAPGATGEGGSLTLRLQGASDTGEGEHHAEVLLEGAFLGEVRWSGLDGHEAQLVVPVGLLQGGSNQLEIVALRDPGVATSLFFVDGFALRYGRSYALEGEPLHLRGDGNAAVLLTTPTDEAPRVYDVSEPRRPRKLSLTASGRRWTLAPAAQAEYLAVTESTLLAPSFLRADVPSDLRSARKRADYVILTAAPLAGAAERLAEYRRGQGHEVLVVDVEDVWDEFSGAQPTPLAIRDFLAYALAHWEVPPRYLVLAGSGHWDYRDLLDRGPNPLPPLLAQTGSGLFGADNLLADFDGDGAPEIAVGRIPAATAADLDVYVDKVIAYEAQGPEGWAGHALALADAPEPGLDYSLASRRLGNRLPGHYQVEEIALGDLAPEDARAQLFAGLAAGVSLVDYFGHGALDRLSAVGLLTSQDAATLQNGSRLPLLTAMTCSVNRFDVPGFDSLGEVLVANGQGGAIAVWAPSGLSDHAPATHLADELYRRLFSTGEEVLLGDAVREALAAFDPIVDPVEMRSLYVLLGDPGLRLARGEAGPPVVGPPDGVPPEGAPRNSAADSPAGRRP